MGAAYSYAMVVLLTVVVNRWCCVAYGIHVFEMLVDNSSARASPRRLRSARCRRARLVCVHRVAHRCPCTLQPTRYRPRGRSRRTPPAPLSPRPSSMENCSNICLILVRKKYPRAVQCSRNRLFSVRFSMFVVFRHFSGDHDGCLPDAICSKQKINEFWNTDAEGRLVMADALVYADQDLKSENIIDMATLTGSTVVALGHSAAGVFTKHEKLWTHLKKGGQQSGDRFYQLPMFQYYADDIEQHNLADLKNCGSRWGGGSKAACFLSNFVNENTAWAHIDMAGFMNNSDGACGYLPKVPFTGRPVRSLIGFLESFLNEKEE